MKFMKLRVIFLTLLMNLVSYAKSAEMSSEVVNNLNQKLNTLEILISERTNAAVAALGFTETLVEIDISLNPKEVFEDLKKLNPENTLELPILGVTGDSNILHQIKLLSTEDLKVLIKTVNLNILTSKNLNQESREFITKFTKERVSKELKQARIQLTTSEVPVRSQDDAKDLGSPSDAAGSTESLSPQNTILWTAVGLGCLFLVVMFWMAWSLRLLSRRLGDSSQTISASISSLADIGALPSAATTQSLPSPEQTLASPGHDHEKTLSNIRDFCTRDSNTVLQIAHHLLDQQSYSKLFLLYGCFASELRLQFEKKHRGEKLDSFLRFVRTEGHNILSNATKLNADSQNLYHDLWLTQQDDQALSYSSLKKLLSQLSDQQLAEHFENSPPEHQLILTGLIGIERLARLISQAILPVEVAVMKKATDASKATIEAVAKALESFSSSQHADDSTLELDQILAMLPEAKEKELLDVIQDERFVSFESLAKANYEIVLSSVKSAALQQIASFLQILSDELAEQIMESLPDITAQRVRNMNAQLGPELGLKLKSQLYKQLRSLNQTSRSEDPEIKAA